MHKSASATKEGAEQSRACVHGNSVADTVPLRIEILVLLFEGGLHDLCDLLQLLLEAAQGAAEGFHSECGRAGGLRGDPVAAGGEKAADEIGGLPGVEARLHQILTQSVEIGFGKTVRHGRALPLSSALLLTECIYRTLWMLDVTNGSRSRTHAIKRFHRTDKYISY